MGEDGADIVGLDGLVVVGMSRIGFRFMKYVDGGLLYRSHWVLNFVSCPASGYDFCCLICALLLGLMLRCQCRFSAFGSRSSAFEGYSVMQFRKC